MSAGLMEITSPFIHNRWFMDKLGYKGTPGFIINGSALVSTLCSVGAAVILMCTQGL